MKLISFEIEGLFGDRNVRLPLTEDALILVGPNGIGKSSVISIFYFFVSRQWRRLLEYKFESIRLHYQFGEIYASYADIGGLNDLAVMLNDQRASFRADQVSRLVSSDLLEEFISKPKLSIAEARNFSELLKISGNELRVLQKYLLRKLDSDDPSSFATRKAIERQLATVVPFRVLYLPTYRRIEKEMKEIFPEFEDRLRNLNSGDSRIETGRTGAFYVELVSFGMEDVRSTVGETMSSLRDYSLTQYNTLSASYLRDVIRRQADDYDSRSISSLTEADVNSILSRVSEDALEPQDKELLRAKIRDIQHRRKTEVDIEDRYLAHYFSRLVSITNEIRDREANISSFVEVCNAYLSPDKHIIYDEVSFSVKIYDNQDREIDMGILSSGEKQIVSIFAHLYLDEKGEQIVIIDEPELSLSVPWQKHFLPDIIRSGYCSLLLAVTHSPFIYANNLSPRALDLRLHTVRR